MTVQTPDTLPQPDIRTLEEIERGVTAINDRRAAYKRDTLSALRIAVQAEGETYKAALIEAARYDRPAPSRASLDTAEAELRKGEEYLAAFDGAIQAIEPERRRAQDRQETARRDALLEELATCRADVARQRAIAAAATEAANAAEHRILPLNEEITRLNLRVGPPARS